MPFWHLQSDGLWTVSSLGGDAEADALARDRGFSSTPSRRELLDVGAVGELDPEFEAAVLADHGLIAEGARSLLNGNWPESLHAHICERVGLEFEALETPIAQARAAALSSDERRRDPEFRVRVLRAYGYHQCAMCRYDGRLDTVSVGLEAAHVRWWAEGGPDQTDDGLFLCSMHHKLFDRGALGVARERRIMVSAQFVALDRAAEMMVRSLDGKDLRSPRGDYDAIAERNRRWYERRVFRNPAR